MHDGPTRWKGTKGYGSVAQAPANSPTYIGHNDAGWYVQLENTRPVCGRNNGPQKHIAGCVRVYASEFIYPGTL